MEIELTKKLTSDLFLKMIITKGTVVSGRGVDCPPYIVDVYYEKHCTFSGADNRWYYVK